ncbi:hypothetical protein ACC740_37050, partial [Rhizobium ruizarguesonis]
SSIGAAATIAQIKAICTLLGLLYERYRHKPIPRLRLINKDLSPPHESNSEQDTSDWRRELALLGCDSPNETRPQR